MQEQIEEDCKNDKSNCGGGGAGGGGGPVETLTHIYSGRRRRRARRLLADRSHPLSALFQLSLALLTQRSDSSACYTPQIVSQSLLCGLIGVVCLIAAFVLF